MRTTGSLLWRTITECCLSFYWKVTLTTRRKRKRKRQRQRQRQTKRIATFRDKSINKWQRKTEVTTGAAAIKRKLHAFNQNISEQVASYMRDPSRVVRQMQMRKSAVSVFGAVPEEKNTAKGEETQSEVGAQADGDPERLDDSEFYQQLLKEFFETIDPASSESLLFFEKVA